MAEEQLLEKNYIRGLGCMIGKDGCRWDQVQGDVSLSDFNPPQSTKININTYTNNTLLTENENLRENGVCRV